jgi:uncharacterized repeat protein (TIGR01451 family)
MRRLIPAALVLAAVGFLVSSAPAATPRAGPQLHCKYGFKYVVKKIHGYKRRVKVCKAKPKPKPPPPQADLELTLNATLDQVTVGNHIAYILVAENNGPETADDVKLTLDLPPGDAEFYGYGSSRPSNCEVEHSDTASHITCSFGELPAESNAELIEQSPYAFLRVVVEPSVPGDFTTSAKVESSTADSHSEDNTVTKPVHVLPGPASADLTVSVSSAPDPAPVPDGFTETISVTNNGPSEATDVYATLLLPQGASAIQPIPFVSDVLVPTGLCPPFAYAYGSTGLACFDAVGVGETRTATLVLGPSIHSPATLETDAVVSAYTRDSNLANNRASHQTAVSPFDPLPGVDLRLAFEEPPELVSGKPFALGFRLENLGLADAREATVEASVTPEIPSLAVYFASSNSVVDCASTAQPVSCPIDELASDTRLRGVLYADPAPAGTYTATVTVSSPDLGAPLTKTLTFEVKPSPARR